MSTASAHCYSAGSLILQQLSHRDERAVPIDKFNGPQSHSHNQHLMASLNNGISIRASSLHSPNTPASTQQAPAPSRKPSLQSSSRAHPESTFPPTHKRSSSFPTSIQPTSTIEQAIYSTSNFIYPTMNSITVDTVSLQLFQISVATSVLTSHTPTGAAKAVPSKRHTAQPLWRPAAQPMQRVSSTQPMLTLKRQPIGVLPTNFPLKDPKSAANSDLQSFQLFKISVKTSMIISYNPQSFNSMKPAQSIPTTAATLKPNTNPIPIQPLASIPTAPPTLTRAGQPSPTEATKKPSIGVHPKPTKKNTHPSFCPTAPPRKYPSTQPVNTKRSPRPTKPQSPSPTRSFQPVHHLSPTAEPSTFPPTPSKFRHYPSQQPISFVYSPSIYPVDMPTPTPIPIAQPILLYQTIAPTLFQSTHQPLLGSPLTNLSFSFAMTMDGIRTKSLSTKCVQAFVNTTLTVLHESLLSVWITVSLRSESSPKAISSSSTQRLLTNSSTVAVIIIKVTLLLGHGETTNSLSAKYQDLFSSMSNSLSTGYYGKILSSRVLLYRIIELENATIIGFTILDYDTNILLLPTSAPSFSGFNPVLQPTILNISQTIDPRPPQIKWILVVCIFAGVVAGIISMRIAIKSWSGDHASDSKKKCSFECRDR